MTKRRLKTGRMPVPFSSIEKLAADELADMALAKLGGPWRLTRHSALHRCKDGTFTLHLVWHAPQKGRTLTSTIRGITVERG